MPTTISQNGGFSARIAHSVYQAISVYGILAAMELDLFSFLQGEGLTAEALSTRLGVDQSKLTPLLFTLVQAGFLNDSNGTFSNTDESSRYLVKGESEYIGNASGFYLGLLTICSKTADSVRTGQPQAKLDFNTLSGEEILAYFTKQVHSSTKSGNALASRLDFSLSRRLLDAGGGTGGVAIALCNHYPALAATVADLPNIVPVAKQFIDEAGLSERITVIPCDMSLTVPQGLYDTVVMRAVIQTMSFEKASHVLRNVGTSLVSGGKIFILGSIVYNSRTGPLSSLAYNLVFLNTYDNGHAYTEAEYRTMLVSSGFNTISTSFEVLDDGTSLICAVKR